MVFFAKIRRITVVVILMFVFINGNVKGQERDFGGWFSFDVSKDLTSRFSMELEQEARIFKNFGEWDRHSTSLSGDFAFTGWLKGGAGYMLLFNHKVNSGTWDTRHRYLIYLQGRQKAGRFTFFLRERFQSTFVKEETTDDLGFEFVNRDYLRSRLKVDYDIKNNKLEPYASAEVYYSLHKSGNNEINDVRYTLGAEFPVGGKFDLDAYLRLDQELNVKNPVNLFVVGVALKLGL
jgi:hypothetical protein